MSDTGQGVGFWTQIGLDIGWGCRILDTNWLGGVGYWTQIGLDTGWGCRILDTWGLGVSDTGHITEISAKNVGFWTQKNGGVSDTGHVQDTPCRKLDSVGYWTELAERGSVSGIAGKKK